MPRLSRGVFITLEGGDGSGKSTLAQALAQLLRDSGYPVLMTEEPGGTALGHRVREFLERQAPGAQAPLEPAAELFLFEAARAQHVSEVIRPALQRGEVVLCDRFADSTLAYQGYGRGLDLEQVRACNLLATDGRQPDLTLLLDMPPAEGLARAGRAKDAIGREPLAFHRRVREGYLALARGEPERIVVLDTSLPKETVAKAAWEKVQVLLAR